MSNEQLALFEIEMPLVNAQSVAEYLDDPELREAWLHISGELTPGDDSEEAQIERAMELAGLRVQLPMVIAERDGLANQLSYVTELLNRTFAAYNVLHAQTGYLTESLDAANAEAHRLGLELEKVQKAQ